MVRSRACERRRGACSRSAARDESDTRSRRAPCARNTSLGLLARAPRSVVAIQEWWHLSPTRTGTSMLCGGVASGFAGAATFISRGREAFTRIHPFADEAVSASEIFDFLLSNYLGAGIGGGANAAGDFLVWPGYVGN